MLSLAQVAQNADWKDGVVVAAAALVALAVLALGWRDVSRFRFRRVRAIAGVCFAESIRRRILWVIPLAVVGVVAVTQLTRPLDAEDAVRQTTKYCLFATGLIVVVAAVILACTNLPKEIESRVIFTIVTKPTTRLEIVLGKVIGFAAVSALILLIMGTFTFGYLEVRAWALGRQIRSSLAADAAAAPGEKLAPGTRARLQRYADAGLLGTKAVRWPDDLQIYGREPTADGTRWMAGAQPNFMVVPFALSDADKEKLVAAVNGGGVPALVATFAIDVRKQATEDERKELEQGLHPMVGQQAIGPAMPTTGPAMPVPRLTFAARATTTGKPVAAANLSAQNQVFARPDRRWQPGGPQVFVAPIAPDPGMNELLAAGRFNVEVTPSTPTLEYGAGPTPLQLVVVDPKTGQALMSVASSDKEPTELPADGAVAHASTPPGPRFYSRVGRVGMQILGRPPEEGTGGIAVYAFRGAGDVTPGTDGRVALQTKVNIDRGGDLDADKYKSSVVALTVRNLKSGAVSEPVLFEPESSRQVDLRVPADAVAGGDFDVMVRGLTPGQHLGLHGLTATVPSVALVQAEHAFVLNLAKGLFVLWLLSTLVVTIAVFTSTFLSWPIAVVLTVLLLLGRWGVDQLGESLSAGASRQVAGELFRLRDPSKNQAVTEGLEALSAVLRNVAPVLPNVDRFPVLEDIDRGVSIPATKVLRALRELLVYGVPLVLLTYLVLRNKEVAP
ncbi:MAG: hypothetical protein JWO31_908 [Phycisphaerales bacterium]|nr:hypothetical protein [Phycisphaerales bacterium]